MNEQAKLILNAYRPGGQDANDPAFADALAQASRDPMLAEWLRESQQFDGAVAEKLREVAPPAALRAKILAGGRASRARRGWTWPKLWAIAAGVALFIGGVIYFQNPKKQEVPPKIADAPPTVAPWQEHALAVLKGIEGGTQKFDRQLPDPAVLLAWLRTEKAPTPGAIPKPLADKVTFGCKKWDWNGHKLSIICFNLGNEQAHIVTIDHVELLKNAPPLGRPVYAKEGEFAFASWSEPGVACMLISNSGEDFVKKLLAVREARALMPVAVLATSGGSR